MGTLNLVIVYLIIFIIIISEKIIIYLFIGAIMHLKNVIVITKILNSIFLLVFHKKDYIRIILLILF